jgi:secreted trypsin-like serine protease
VVLNNDNHSFLIPCTCTLELAKEGSREGSGDKFLANTDKDLQVGIISWGARILQANFYCVSDIFPGVYSWASEYYDWIVETVSTLSVDPSAYFNCGFSSPGMVAIMFSLQ